MGSIGEAIPIAPRPKILFIDAYDSFSNNITSLLTTLLDVDVFVLAIDTPISRDDFHRELSHYEAVVCGPGPGSPENEADVGLMRWLWETEGDVLIPVLGVCLGFQSLVLACGGKVRRLRRGLHGMVRRIEHLSGRKPAREGDVFVGVEEFKATLYHSLCADVGQDSVKDWELTKWDPPTDLPDILPLAWVEEDRADGNGRERILMALKHRRKPFWGLQHHPESVCTEEEGNQVVRNWFREALQWNHENCRIINTNYDDIRARNAVRPSLLQQVSRRDFRHQHREDSWKRLFHTGDEGLTFRSEIIDLPPAGLEVPDIVELLTSTDNDHIILESANANQPPPKTGVDVRGRFSIIALEVDKCVRVEHNTSDDFIDLVIPRRPRVKVSLGPGQTAWHLLAEFHELKRVSLKFDIDMVPDEHDAPFLGGFVGYVTYEQGLNDIGIALPRNRGHRRPDLCLAWATRSIVMDHERGVVHVQDLEGDAQWIKSVAKKLKESDLWRYGYPSTQKFAETTALIQKPEQAKYEAKVRMCQEYIAAGDSYELCLTDQTNITRTIRQPENGSARNHLNRGLHATPKQGRMSSNKASGPRPDTSWHLYRALRRRNPAPFASYIRLGGATLVSSSPERFLQYNCSGLCSMKPMKGTVKKASEPGEGCATTLAEAEAILHIPKEEAENLMIVDLVRHDLHGICGAGHVAVPELLKVEEYQTVYTMITVVEGQLPQSERGNAPTRYSGLDVLSASLPPGSMTGAPKKRSCEILQQIENGKERSLYSGVVGYMCVTGRGDWSVTIRSMFRWDDECESGEGKKEEVWHIGAGGAVTTLSTPEGEREEMFVKLARPLSMFTEDW